jgi:hypothetical protein
VSLLLKNLGVLGGLPFLGELAETIVLLMPEHS